MSKVRRGPPHLTYFAELAFFAAAHRAFTASEIFFLAAADITLFLAGTDFSAATFLRADFFFGPAFVAGAAAVLAAPGADMPCKSESRIFVRRSISSFSSATAPVMWSARQILCQLRT